MGGGEDPQGPVSVPDGWAVLEPGLETPACVPGVTPHPTQDSHVLEDHGGRQGALPVVPTQQTGPCAGHEPTWLLGGKGHAGLGPAAGLWHSWRRGEPGKTGAHCGPAPHGAPCPPGRRRMPRVALLLCPAGSREDSASAGRALLWCRPPTLCGPVHVGLQGCGALRRAPVVAARDPGRC